MGRAVEQGCVPLHFFFVCTQSSGGATHQPRQIVWILYPSSLA